jgi:GTP cyclohydrolase IA
MSTVNEEKAAAAYKEFLENMGFDVDNLPHMKDTPKRVVKMYMQELFAGCYNEPPSITKFEDASIEGGSQMIFSGPIEVRSTCSHHMLPISGFAYIGLIFDPKTTLPGLSKYARIVEHYSSMPQVQEKLVQQIATHLINNIDGVEGVGVTIKARHFCMSHRGVRSPNAFMINTALRGKLMLESAKAEFQSYIDQASRYSST